MRIDRPLIFDVYRRRRDRSYVYVERVTGLPVPPRFSDRMPYRLRVRPRCHCGRDGHALNSVNCPVHGESITRYRWIFAA